MLAALGLITLPVHIADAAGAGRAAPVPGVGRRALRAMVAQRDRSLGIVLGTVAGGRRARRRRARCTACGRRTIPLGVVGWYLAGLACFIAIGVRIGSLVPSGRSAAALGNLVFVPMFLLGGGGPPRR